MSALILIRTYLTCSVLTLYALHGVPTRALLNGTAGKMSSMTSKPIILRQHIRGSETAVETTLSLSLNDEEVSYTIVIDGDQLGIVEGKDSQIEGSALIHTRDGFACVESLKPIVKVQSIASGFDGTSANGVMQLQVSDASQKILYQLHPGESLFVGPFTISIVPEEYRDIPASPSAHDNYRERISQQINGTQSSSLKAFGTPAPNFRSSFSSPSHTTTRLESTITALYLQCHGEKDEPTGLAELNGATLNKQNKTVDGRVPTPQANFIGIEVPCEENPPQASDWKGTFDGELERSDFMGSAATVTPDRTSRKRPGFPMAAQDSSDEGETQESMRSNIIVQAPDLKRTKITQEANLNEFFALQENAESRTQHEVHDQDNSGDLPPERAETKDSEPIASSATKPRLNLLQSPNVSMRILFASSTSVKDSRPLMRFLEKQGVHEAFDVTSCTALCVSNTLELKKTGKLIMAVLQGKSVITDDWVVRSSSAGKLLDIEDFKANDRTREAEWGIVLDDAIRQSRYDTPKPFKGWTLAFTPAAKKDAGTSAFHELKEIALYAGATCCSTVLPKKPQEESQPTLIIACPNDPASASLKGRWRCFSRDIIGLSSLRGKLDVDSDEFLVESDTKTPKGGLPCKKRTR